MRDVWLNKTPWQGIGTPTVFIQGLALASIVSLAAWLTLNIHALGSRFAHFQPDMALDYAIGMVWWAVFALAILIFGGASSRMLLAAWLGRLFVTLIAMLFYEQHYGLDSYEYFRFSLTGRGGMMGEENLYENLMPSLSGSVQSRSEDSAIPLGAENTHRFILLLRMVTGPFFHAMKVGCAFLGLLGVWYFYRAVVVAMGRPYPPAFYLLAFFPSILFWGSTLGKDPLQFFFLGLYAYGGAIWLVEGRMAALWFLGVGLLGSYMIRPGIGVISVIALTIATFFGRSRWWQTGFLILMSLPMAAQGFLQVGKDQSFSLQSIEKRVTYEVVAELIQEKAQGIARDTQTTRGSGVDLSNLTSGEAVINRLPEAMFSGLFRPLPFDISNPMTALAAIENTVVLVLAVAAIFQARFGYLRDSLFLWMATYLLLWTTTHGFIVMANFGSGARYKLQAWPFLLMGILLLVHREGRSLLASRLPAQPVSPESANLVPSGQAKIPT